MLQLQRYASFQAQPLKAENQREGVNASQETKKVMDQAFQALIKDCAKETGYIEGAGTLYDLRTIESSLKAMLELENDDLTFGMLKNRKGQFEASLTSKEDGKIKALRYLYPPTPRSSSSPLKFFYDKLQELLSFAEKHPGYSDTPK